MYRKRQFTDSTEEQQQSTSTNMSKSHQITDTDLTKNGSCLSRFIHYNFVPLILMLTTPNAVLPVWYLCQKCDGSYLELGRFLTANDGNVFVGLLNIWKETNIVTLFSVSVVLGFAAWALVTMTLIPGKEFRGPLTPKGNIPVYKDNGFYSYCLTMFLLMVTSKFYDITIIYDRFDEIIATLCIFSLIFCLGLYIKGHVAPSSSDSGSSGHVIFDYYWGMELYPRIGNIDIKVFTNCRFGMVAWPCLVYIFALKSFKLHGFVDSMFVTAILQLAYFTKFFWWESGYMSTIDIMVDRAGYMICWGCLVWVPGFYTSVSQYLVNHPVQLGLPLTVCILLAGLISLILNYVADFQKQIVRKTNGDCMIWGREPTFIRAQYTLENGEKKESILLTSGFWGVARHFNYLPELTLALSWSLPALFENIFPYSYFIFLIILLVHRSIRDEEKCMKKYGKYWEEYKKQVPYKIVPGIF